MFAAAPIAITLGHEPNHWIYHPSGTPAELPVFDLAPTAEEFTKRTLRTGGHGVVEDGKGGYVCVVPEGRVRIGLEQTAGKSGSRRPHSGFVLMGCPTNSDHH